MTDPHDSVDDALADLGTHDVDHWRREHARLRAYAALEAKPPGLYTRWVEPLLTFGICAAHLVWAIARAAAILMP
ncbi:MAG: hypothetical protein KC619_27090 [Myxococcales bacterium]|nr:hypothetical protein [Myxococcales bacterium]